MLLTQPVEHDQRARHGHVERGGALSRQRYVVKESMMGFLEFGMAKDPGVTVPVMYLSMQIMQVHLSLAECWH